MSKGHHVQLSFAWNGKLLNPFLVIHQVLDAYLHSDGKPGLAQIEGLIRQVLGWREHVRCIYWHLIPELERMNFFGHTMALPAYCWTGETDMRCIRQAITQSLTYAYAHHIQRLMVTDNFTLLAGVSPPEVEAWYHAASDQLPGNLNADKSVCTGH